MLVGRELTNEAILTGLGGFFFPLTSADEPNIPLGCGGKKKNKKPHGAKATSDKTAATDAVDFVSCQVILKCQPEWPLAFLTLQLCSY